MLNTDLELELFQANGIFGTDAIDTMITNARALRDVVKVPLIIGHAAPKEQPERGRMEQPAVAWLKPASLRRVGDKMLGTFTELAPIVRRAIEQKTFRRTSAEIYFDWARTRSERDLQTGCTGPTLAAAAILGSTIPMVKTLADLDTYLHGEEEQTVWADEAEERVLHAAGESPQLSDGARSVKHRVSSIQHNAKHASDHLAQLTSHANDLADLLDVDTREPDADADDATTTNETRPLTPSERIARCEGMLADIQKRNTAATVLLSEYGSGSAPSRPRTFSVGFAPDVADSVGSLAHLFLNELESALLGQGLNREDVSARRKVARELLAAWKDRPASGNGPNPEGKSLADQLDPDDYRHAVEDFGTIPQTQQYAEGALPTVIVIAVPAEFVKVKTPALSLLVVRSENVAPPTPLGAPVPVNWMLDFVL